MSKWIQYTTFHKNIIETMLQCDEKDTAERLVEFIKTKNEKISYDQEEEKYYINSFYPTIPSSAWNRLVNGVSAIVNEEKRVPLQADIVVTGKCHCHCWHCFRSKYTEEDMSLATIQECMESLYQLGTATVGITGGEPMLRSDILDILNAIPDGLEGQLYTTGYRMDEEFARKIKKTNVTRCIISLDHYDEEVVCQLRHNSNAFQEALKAIQVLTKHKMYTAVTVCITDALLELDELKRYFEFIQELGVSEIRVVMPIPQGRLEGRNVGRIYGEAMKLIKKFRKEYAKKEGVPTIVNFCELESPAYFGCGAGANYISINNNGLITPCVAVPLSFGSIYKEPLEKIYHNMKEYFIESSQVCYGIASGRIISKEKVDVTNPPISVEVSKRIAEQCKLATGRAALFQYCKNDKEKINQSI